MALVYHGGMTNWNTQAESGKMERKQSVGWHPPREGGPMLATRHRFGRNPYFQFQPLHGLLSLLGALILFGLLVWFLAIPAR